MSFCSFGDCLEREVQNSYVIKALRRLFCENINNKVIACFDLMTNVV